MLPLSPPIALLILAVTTDFSSQGGCWGFPDRSQRFGPFPASSEVLYQLLQLLAELVRKLEAASAGARLYKFSPVTIV